MMFSTSNGPDSPRLNIDAEEFGKLFPFHFACDREMRILQVGGSLHRVCPEIQPGADVRRILTMERPEVELAFENIVHYVDQLVLIRHRERGFILRGKWLLVEHDAAAMFIGSPWLTSTAQFSQFGLQIDDFAVHDPVVDMLQVVQSHDIGLRDTRRLNERLIAQREKLKEANQRLEAQNQILQESESQTRMLGLVASRTVNGVIITNAEGGIIWVNDGFRRITGYDLEEVRGKKPGSFLQGPETDRKVVAQIRKHLAAGVGFDAELVNYGKNGRRYWIAIEVQPIRDDEGRIINFMAIESDITERKRSEQRRDLQYGIVRTLSEASSLNEGLRGVLESIGLALGWKFAAFWSVDEAAGVIRPQEIWVATGSNIESFVDASRKLTFISGVGLPGRVWLSGKAAWVKDASVDPNFPRAPWAIENNLRGAFAMPCEVGGHVMGVMEFISQQVEEPDHDLMNLMGSIGRQIGLFIVREQFKSALRETNALQKAILSSAAYSIIATAPDGMIKTFNTTAERMLGYRADEVIGKVTPGIIHVPEEVVRRAGELSMELGRTVTPGFEVFVANVSPGRVDEREWTYVRKDGTRFPVMLAVTALADTSGAIMGYLGIAHDITERRRAIKAILEAKEEAERLARTKGEFLANMSHEIRTPINAIVGMTELLRDSPLDPRQQDQVETIDTSSRILTHLVNDILDLSKIEAGRLLIENQPFDLHELTGEVDSIIASMARRKGLHFTIGVDEKVPGWLIGDSLRIKQVLLNLLGNAIKFTERGAINFEVRGESGNIWFRVKDTGIGMSDEMLKRLFEPFEQGDASTTRRFGGTGLGLAISGRLVNLMGGAMQVQSRPGEGAVFEFHLPLAGTRPKPREEPPEVVTSGLAGALELLLVEDNPVNQKVVRAMLEKLGHRVESAWNGVEAVGKFAEKEYDAILMDIQMPEMDGLEATRVIREKTGTRERPWIIATTANAMEEDRRMCLESGMNDYISKPIRGEELARCLGRIRKSEG